MRKEVSIKVESHSIWKPILFSMSSSQEVSDIMISITLDMYKASVGIKESCCKQWSISNVNVDDKNDGWKNHTTK